MERTTREMTFEEEAAFYEKEARAEFAKETGNGDCCTVNGILRRGMRIISKARREIANGVTVQEWISVKDRLPKAGTKALCYLKRGEYWTAVWDDCGDDLWSDGEAWCSNGEVTHWMPLPQPPKGE